MIYIYMIKNYKNHFLILIYTKKIINIMKNLKHLKTFEGFNYNNEIIEEGFFGPKDGEWSKDINTNWKSLQNGKLSKESLKKKFEQYGSSFGFDGQNAINYAGKQAPTVYSYLYKNADAKTVKEEEFAKVHFDRCKSVKKEGEKWIDDTLVKGKSGVNDAR